MSTTTNLLEIKTSVQSTRLTVMVKGKSLEGVYWRESTELISLSRTGAGFYLDQRCHTGQLLSLMLPMPRHLRCYDQEKEFYRVWGLVQHSYLISGDGANSNRYHVGLALIGRQPPESYHQNSFQSYRIVGINEDGLWKVTETKTPFVNRRYARFQTTLDVLIQVFDGKDRIVAEEKTVTENISQRGAALFSELDVCVGECVRFNSKNPDFSVLAVVRNHKYIDHGVRKLHLEFITEDFPIREVGLSPQEINQIEETEAKFMAEDDED